MVGTVTLSMEVELAWGQIDEPGSVSELFSDRRQLETDTLEKLLSLCDDRRIPISFDVVGHLLEESCEGTHEGPHERDWFANDPGTGVDSDPLYYAPDLVNMIRDAGTDHEICTHSYSHVLGDEIDPEVLAWELEAVDELWDARGLASPVSYVPPRHQSLHHETLRRSGIAVVRTPIDTIDLSGGPLRSFVQRQRLLIPDVSPRERNGVFETYSTPFPSLSSGTLPNGQRPPPRILQLLPVRIRQRLHHRWLLKQTRATIRRDGHLHLWTHLFNISNDQQLEPLFQYLSDLAELRDEGLVTIETMSELRTHSEGSP